MSKSEKDKIREQINEQKICVIIPSYNNAKTVGAVVNSALQYAGNVIVVDDGSTDNTAAVIEKLPVIKISHSKNKGKGSALKSGFAKAKSEGFDYAITIDADGQHYPEDIPVFLEHYIKNSNALIVGSRSFTNENMPKKNTFANRFSNFWFYVETGLKLHDTQTGYRLYPLKLLRGLSFVTSRYEAELELLVFSAWSGIEILPVDVRVYYPPVGERVSHFRPFWDFFRISVLNTILCLLAVFFRIKLLFRRQCK